MGRVKKSKTPEEEESDSDTADSPTQAAERAAEKAEDGIDFFADDLHVPGGQPGGQARTIRIRN